MSWHPEPETLYETWMESKAPQPEPLRCPCCNTVQPGHSAIAYCDDCNTDTCGHWTDR